MTKIVFSKVMWVGRATVFAVGFAVILAVVLGVATTALAAVPGDPFKLGKVNTIDALSSLAGSVNNAMLKIDNNSTGANSTALDLQVQPGKAPMKVNSATRVAGLNADKLDGKSVGQIGVNGWERVEDSSAFDSNSPKSAMATCPAGKVVVGTGAEVSGAKSDIPPNQLTDVVINEISPLDRIVFVEAYEEEPTSANWHVFAYAICATAP